MSPPRRAHRGRRSTKSGAAKPNPPAFDPAAFGRLDEKIESTRPRRAELEVQWKAERDHRMSVERASELLRVIADGTPKRPIATGGRVVIATARWAALIRATALELLQCIGPYRSGNLPRFIAPFPAEGEGHVVARAVLDLALRGSSLRDIRKCLAEGLARLRRLRQLGLPENPRDSELGVADYFHNLGWAFYKRAGHLWVDKNEVLDLVVHIGRRADGSIGRLGAQQASTTSEASTAIALPAPTRPLQPPPKEMKVLADYGEHMITKDAFRKFVGIDIDPSHDSELKQRMPDPVWVAPYRWPWYRVRDLVAVFQRCAKVQLAELPVNDKLRRKLKQPSDRPRWHAEATRRPRSST